MVEVLVCKDKNITNQLYDDSNVILTDKSLCIRAIDGEEFLGYCLFEIDGTRETVNYIYPENNRLLADGLLRTALHIGNERGITEAFYGDSVGEELLNNIDFLEDKKEKRLKLQNLFTDCCHCSSKQN